MQFRRFRDLTKANTLCNFTTRACAADHSRRGADSRAPSIYIVVRERLLLEVGVRLSAEVGMVDLFLPFDALPVLSTVKSSSLSSSFWSSISSPPLFERPQSVEPHFRLVGLERSPPNPLCEILDALHHVRRYLASDLCLLL